MHDAAQLLWFVGAMVLVGSALAARRIPMGSMARMALAWVVIFAVLFALVSLWQSMTGDAVV